MPGRRAGEGAMPPLPPVGGKFTPPPAAVRALMIAGRLLQSKDWPGGKVRIQSVDGESYPEAVARVITNLSPASRGHLRESVSWVMDFEDADTGW